MNIDIIMAIVTIAFVYSIIPQIIKVIRDKRVEIAWQTLFITSIGLWTMAFCFGTLSQHLTSITNYFSASGWTFLLCAKFYYRIQ